MNPLQTNRKNKTMKKSLLALAATVLCGAASADFSGPTAAANWTVANTGTLTGAPISIGMAAFTLAQLTLTGANAATGCAGGVYGFAGPCQMQATINLAGIYSFDYVYGTLDADGPMGDIFGVIVNGVRVSPFISDPGGAVTQSGTRSFVASSSFGFFLNCTDCTGDTATVTITNFNLSPIPEPSSLALWLAGGLVAAVSVRRRHGALGSAFWR